MSSSEDVSQSTIVYHAKIYVVGELPGRSGGSGSNRSVPCSEREGEFKSLRGTYNDPMAY